MQLRKSEQLQGQRITVAVEARERSLAVYVARYPRSATLARDAAIVEFTPEG